MSVAARLFEAPVSYSNTAGSARGAKHRDSAERDEADQYYGSMFVAAGKSCSIGGFILASTVLRSAPTLTLASSLPPVTGIDHIQIRYPRFAAEIAARTRPAAGGTHGVPFAFEVASEKIFVT
jgi:hypothetical protein